MESKNDKINLWSFLGTLYKWKKFLIISFIVLSIFSVTISLVLPFTYTSTALIMPPGGPPSLLSSFLPSDMTTGLGSAIGGILGQGSDQANKALAILGSRTLSEKTINKFHLRKRFSSPTIEDAIKAFHQKMQFQLNDDGTITITSTFKTGYFHPHQEVENTRQLSANVTNYVVNELNNIYTKLEVESATRRRELIEKRYNENVSDIDSVTQKMKDFEKKYGIVSLPDQIQASVNVAASIETDIIKSQIQLQTLKQTLSPNQSQIKQKTIEINQLQDKLSSILNGKLSADSLKLLPSFSKIPALSASYANIKREAEVQGLLYQYLTQIYEQAKIAESQNNADIQIIDQGSVPTKRSAPRRSIIVILAVFAGMILSCLYVFMKERMATSGINWRDIKHRITE